MLKKIEYAILAIACLCCFSGCALIGTAISAGIGYGIYQATKK